MTDHHTHLSVGIWHWATPASRAQISPTCSVGSIRFWTQHPYPIPRGRWGGAVSSASGNTFLLSGSLHPGFLKSRLATACQLFNACPWKQKLRSWESHSTAAGAASWRGAAGEPGLFSSPAAHALQHRSHHMEAFKSTAKVASPGFPAANFKSCAQHL